MLGELNSLTLELKPQMVDFCRRLIRVPAISGDEKRIADLYLREMEKLGYDEIFRDDWGNVVGIIKGSEAGPTIMYNTHLDHVDPGDYSEWEGYDPYGAEVDIAAMDNQDGDGTELVEVIHGRAASDVKGGGAAQIYAGAVLLRLRELGYRLKGKFLFTGVVLEEPAEQLGTIMLIDETFKQKDLDYDCVVSSEATSLKLCLGHRGKMEINVTVHGRTAHGSTPWLGINAVNKAAKLITKIENELPKYLLQDEDLGSSSIALTNIRCTPGELAIVPDRCYITFDCRMAPGDDESIFLEKVKTIIAQIAALDQEFKATVEVATCLRTSYTGKSASIPNSKGGWKIAKHHPVVNAATLALQEIGQPVKYAYWDFGTDLSKIFVTDKKPAIGYSGMQEKYCHRPIDKVRIDFIEKSIAGNAAIFLKLVELPKEVFKISI